MKIINGHICSKIANPNSRNASTLTFIDLWPCKVFPIQNTLPKAKNTKSNFLAFSLRKKLVLVFFFLKKYKLLLKLPFEKIKLFSSSNDNVSSCLALLLRPAFLLIPVLGMTWQQFQMGLQLTSSNQKW